MRRRQRGVAAQVDLGRRREPAQIEMVRGLDENAVSDRLFSSAIACMVASSGQVLSGHTAAGLPPNTRLVKASI